MRFLTLNYNTWPCPRSHAVAVPVCCGPREANLQSENFGAEDPKNRIYSFWSLVLWAICDHLYPGPMGCTCINGWSTLDVWSFTRVVCVRLLMCCEHRERPRCSGRSELQVWGLPCRAPGPMGQMDVAHLRIFLLPACGSDTRQSAGAMEDLGS